MEQFDVVVIGAGPGGYPAAIRAAQLGFSVALIEKEALGGTCLNWGCIPTKTLIAGSSLFHAMNHSKKIGVHADHVTFDYPSMIRYKNEVVKKLRTGVTQILKANKITIFEGTGTFISRNRILIRNNKSGETKINAGHTIIATGSEPVLPDFLPVNNAIMDSRAFLDTTQLPQNMIVLGGGVIGCELACMAAQLGVKVSIVEILNDILMPLDSDLRDQVRRHMEHQLKISILTGNPLEHVKTGKHGVMGKVKGQTIDTELLLAAAGRKPVTKDLALDKAGVKTSNHGYIQIDKYCQTTSASIYAIGDVTGGPQLAHAATAQGLRAVENITENRYCSANQIIPSCIFTSPEIGTVGLSEQEASQQNREIITGKFMFAACGKAVASGETTGFVKWIVDPSTDQLIGAKAIGLHATELIAEATLAIQSECTARGVAETIHAHPTLSEAWMEAANDVHGQCINSIPRSKK